MKKKISMIVSIALIVLILVGCGKLSGESSGDSFETKDDEPGTYTIMIYMVGSNLESTSYCASKDIIEMIDSGVDLNNTNIVLCTGGALEWGISISNAETSINEIKEVDGEFFLHQIGSFGKNVNMGEADTLSQFLNYTFENYKTDKYGLICWNHGGGPIRGYGNDELYEYDSIMLDEMKGAFESSPFKGDNKLEWIGFDACLMGSIEIANLLSNYSDYLIASEEVEPGYGWDYSFLSTLNETSSTEKIAKSIIDSYSSYIEANASVEQYPDVTLSCLNLRKIDSVTNAMDALFAKMEDGLNNGDFQKLAKLRAGTKTFHIENNLDLVDLGDVGKVVSELYPKESKALNKALEEFVVYQATNLASTYGVSIYYPYCSSYDYALFEYLDTGATDYLELMYLSKGYSSYFERYLDILLNGEPSTEWETSPVELDNAEDVGEAAGNNQLIVQLSDEQLNELSAAYYTILCDTGNGKYTPALMDCEVVPDKDGLLRIDLDQDLIVATSGEVGSDQFMMFKELEQREDGVLYQSVNTAVSGPFGVFSHTNPEAAAVKIFETNDGEIHINSIDYVGVDETIVGKQAVNLAHWDTLSYMFSVYQPVYDENNNLLPYNQWTKADGIYARETMLGNLEFKKKNIADFNESFVCQVTVVDIYGNVYATDLVQMYDDEYPIQHVENLSDGNYTWELYEDYAKLVLYEGTAAEVNVPDTVKNLPVKVIGSYAFKSTTTEEIILPESVTTLESYAFSNNTNLQSVKLSDSINALPEGCFSYCSSLIDIIIPNSVEHIGRFAFQECTALKNIEIPESVETISPGVFYGCDYLKKLEVHEKNKNYKAVDGVLFTSDMKQLIACPSLFRTTYSVPEGVEEICDFAFGKCYMEKLSGNQIIGYGLTEIEFPKTLKIIGDGAFMECTRLKSIVLPESLEIIGSLAFGDEQWFEVGGSIKAEDSVLSSVEIGKNVTWIGDKAFASFVVDEFVVSEDNMYYSADGNKITNKNGTLEINVFYE